MKIRRVRCGNSGQALIITSLIIALLLLSTTYYVFEVEREVTRFQATPEQAFQAIKLGARNTMISALENVSNGGEREVLETNLKRLIAILASKSYGTDVNISFTPLNSSSYQDGIWIAWGSDGFGISSACVSFSINSSETSTNYQSTYESNVTTALKIEGAYTGEGNEKTVTATFIAYDENGPTTANNTFVSYQDQTDGPWILADSSNNLNIVDYGNGTYIVSFTAFVQESIRVSMHIHDLRGIFVMANVTCVRD